MTTPIVKELPRHLEPVTRDTFIDRLAGAGVPVPVVTAFGMLQSRRREPPALAFTVLGGFSVTRGSWRADDAAWERRVARRFVRSC